MALYNLEGSVVVVVVVAVAFFFLYLTNPEARKSPHVSCTLNFTWLSV